MNAELPIDVMLFGMVIEVSEVAPSKALRPIEVRALPAPKVTVLSAVAPLNVLLPIEVTLFGMVIEVSEVAPSKALFAIEVRALPAAKDTVWRAL